MTGCLRVSGDDPLYHQLGLGAAALRYAQLGYPVLPLLPRAKRPHPMLGEHGGVHHATTHYGQIISWWQQDRVAGIGVATGAASGVVVIDLDVKHGQDGHSNWWQFLQGNGLNIATGPSCAVRTPSGGMHLWLRHPAPLAGRQGILPGVDIKADGGYVVVPPSMVDVMPLAREGEWTEPVLLPYQWEVGCPCSVPPAPLWMGEWVASVPEQRAVTGVAANASTAAADLIRAEAHGLEQGSRNASLHKIACSLYLRLGTTQEASAVVAERVRKILERTDRTGFGDGEVAGILASARTWAAGQRQARESLYHQALDMVRGSS